MANSDHLLFNCFEHPPTVLMGWYFLIIVMNNFELFALNLNRHFLSKH